MSERHYLVVLAEFDDIPADQVADVYLAIEAVVQAVDDLATVGLDGSTSVAASKAIELRYRAAGRPLRQGRIEVVPRRYDQSERYGA